MKTATLPLKQITADGVLRNNIVTIRLLALCPMLAVSTSIKNALLLGLLTSAVMAAAGAGVAGGRRSIPDAVRLPVFLLIVATLVIIADLLTESFAPTAHRQLGIFLPLIVTNCAVLARLEVFAVKQPPLAAAVDGFVTGAGMTAVLFVLAAVRELLSSGQIGDIPIIPLFSGLPIAALPVGGFFLFGLLLVIIRQISLRRNSQS